MNTMIINGQKATISYDELDMSQKSLNRFIAETLEQAVHP